MLRLNMAIPPSSSPSPLGLLGGDLAGFPNGRRVVDDVVTIEIRAVAGVTIPLVDPTFTPDGAAGARDAGPHPQRVALPGDRSRTWACRSTGSTTRPLGSCSVASRPGHTHRPVEPLRPPGSAGRLTRTARWSSRSPGRSVCQRRFLHGRRLGGSAGRVVGYSAADS